MCRGGAARVREVRPARPTRKGERANVSGAFRRNDAAREGTPRAAAHESDKTDRATALPRTVLNDERNMRTDTRKHERK